MASFLMENASFSKFSRNYMRLKKDLPIRPSEMGVLNIIVQTPGPHTPLMLAEKLDVSKPMMTAHIRALGHHGYVEKVPSPEDGRAVYILPTDKAKALVASVQAQTDAQLEHLCHDLGENDFHTLVTLITRANTILEEFEHEHY